MCAGSLPGPSHARLMGCTGEADRRCRPREIDAGAAAGRRETTCCLWMVARPVTCALQSSRRVRRDSSPASRHHPRARRPRAGSGQEISLSCPEEERKKDQSAAPVFARWLRVRLLMELTPGLRKVRPVHRARARVRGQDSAVRQEAFPVPNPKDENPSEGPCAGISAVRPVGRASGRPWQLRRAVHRCDGEATRSAKPRRWCGTDRGPSISSPCRWPAPDARPAWVSHLGRRSLHQGCQGSIKAAS
jgi:hypothetical protein